MRSLFPFLAENEAHVQRNGVTDPEPHRFLSGTGRFHGKSFDSKSHLLSLKRKWCCRIHVSHKSWVKAMVRPRQRERWSLWSFFHQYPTYLHTGRRNRMKLKWSCFLGLTSLVPSRTHHLSFSSSPKRHLLKEKRTLLFPLMYHPCKGAANPKFNFPSF